MNYEILVEKIIMLEYHQKLLIKMVGDSKHSFYKLVIEQSLREEDVKAFYNLCNQLSIDLREQKAEGFVHFHPLFDKFKEGLHPNFQAEEVIKSCLAQQLFTPLMKELSKYTD